MLDLIHAAVNHDDTLLYLHLFLHQLHHLLLQEYLLVDVHLLQFLKVSLDVHNVLHYLLESVICGLDGLVLERRKLGPQQLHILLVLVQ